jgi:hypothetical protein
MVANTQIRLLVGANYGVDFKKIPSPVGAFLSREKVIAAAGRSPFIESHFPSTNMWDPIVSHSDSSFTLSSMAKIQKQIDFQWMVVQRKQTIDIAGTGRELGRK